MLFWDAKYCTADVCSHLHMVALNKMKERRDHDLVRLELQPNILKIPKILSLKAV